MSDCIDPEWCAWMTLHVAEYDLDTGHHRDWTDRDRQEIAEAIIVVCQGGDQ